MDPEWTFTGRKKHKQCINSSVARFSARNYRTKGQKLSFFGPKFPYFEFLAQFFTNLTKLTWQKVVCPVQIIVFQNLRSFFTFSGPKLSYNYRIIVHLATLINSTCKDWRLEVEGRVGDMWRSLEIVEEDEVHVYKK